MHVLAACSMHHGDPGESQVRRAEELVEQSQPFDPRHMARASFLACAWIHDEICLTEPHRKPRFAGFKTLRMGARSIEVFPGRCSQTCGAACWGDRIGGAGKPCPIGHLLSGSGSQAASFAQAPSFPWV